jgi:hypothetical protein
VSAKESFYRACVLRYSIGRAQGFYCEPEGATIVAHFDASTAECLVCTYKEGLLAPVAHDLKIRVSRFVIDADEQTRRITARFDAGSLRVVCAMRGDAEMPGVLSRENKREIEATIVRDVLHAEQYPEIGFTSSETQRKGEGYLLKGTLDLHGRQRQLSIPVREQLGRYIAESRIHQPTFGIQPYRALMGALRVGADVTVRVSVPVPDARG